MSWIDQTATSLTEPEGELRQFLTFTVGGSEFGVNIMDVREIRGWVDITRLPNTPDYMRGVMNLRGSIIPIFDVRQRFGQGMTETTPKHVIVILAVGRRNIGLLVDAVSDILNVSESQIRPAPDEGDTHAQEAYVEGLISLEERMVVLLTVAHLFAETRQNMPLDIPAAAPATDSGADAVLHSAA